MTDASQVTCIGCKRAHYTSFDACPFCGTSSLASITAATAAVAARNAIVVSRTREGVLQKGNARCAQCRRQYYETFATCPFCPVTVTLEPEPFEDAPETEPEFTDFTDAPEAAIELNVSERPSTVMQTPEEYAASRAALHTTCATCAQAYYLTFKTCPFCHPYDPGNGVNPAIPDDPSTP